MDCQVEHQTTETTLANTLAQILQAGRDGAAVQVVSQRMSQRTGTVLYSMQVHATVTWTKTLQLATQSGRDFCSSCSCSCCCLWRVCENTQRGNTQLKPGFAKQERFIERPTQLQWSRSTSVQQYDETVPILYFLYDRAVLREITLLVLQADSDSDSV